MSSFHVAGEVSQSTDPAISGESSQRTNPLSQSDQQVSVLFSETHPTAAQTAEESPSILNEGSIHLTMVQLKRNMETIESLYKDPNNGILALENKRDAIKSDIDYNNQLIELFRIDIDQLVNEEREGTIGDVKAFREKISALKEKITSFEKTNKNLAINLNEIRTRIKAIQTEVGKAEVLFDTSIEEFKTLTEERIGRIEHLKLISDSSRSGIPYSKIDQVAARFKQLIQFSEEDIAEVFFVKINNVSDDFIKNSQEIITNAENDKTLIKNKFDLKGDLRLKEIHLHSQETHNKGGFVCFLTFESTNDSGSTESLTLKLVRKPRPIDVDKALTSDQGSLFSIVDIESKHLGQIPYLSRESYGYALFLTPQTVSPPSQKAYIEKVAEHFGYTAGLARVIPAEDLHQENCIFAGQDGVPYWIDDEVVFNPSRLVNMESVNSGIAVTFSAMVSLDTADSTSSEDLRRAVNNAYCRGYLEAFKHLNKNSVAVDQWTEKLLENGKLRVRVIPPGCQTKTLKDALNSTVSGKLLGNGINKIIESTCQKNIFDSISGGSTWRESLDERNEKLSQAMQLCIAHDDIPAFEMIFHKGSGTDTPYAEFQCNGIIIGSIEIDLVDKIKSRLVAFSSMYEFISSEMVGSWMGKEKGAWKELEISLQKMMVFNQLSKTYEHDALRQAIHTTYSSSSNTVSISQTDIKEAVSNCKRSLDEEGIPDKALLRGLILEKFPDVTDLPPIDFTRGE